jgi:hypothetical protein
VVTQASRFTKLQRAVATAMLVGGCGLLLTTSALNLTSMAAEIEVTWGTQIGGAVWSIALLAFPVVGWIVVRRHGENLIGWLLLWVGLAAGIDFLSAGYGVLAMRPGSGLPFAPQVANVGTWGWMLYISTVGVFVTHLFPTGRPLSRRWGRWLWVLVALLLAAAVGSALQPGGLEVDPDITNPFGVDHPIVGFLQVGMVALPLGVISGVVSVALRYRRADPIERAQLRWFVAAATLVAVGFVPVMVLSSMAPDGAFPLWLGVFQDVVNTLWSGIAVAVGVAIFRYRLYAVDVVINRALVYGSLTAILAGVYLMAVVAFQAVLPFGGEGQLAVAVSTLVVAVLFGPLRRRIQSFIDRRFYRARYDAQQLAASFAARMRRQIDLDDIAAELEAAVRSAVQPASASVWLRPR